MKKVLSLTALLAALSISIASAWADTRTITLCSLPLKKLTHHGFTQGAIYTDEQVKNFFKILNVEPEDMSQLHPGVHYTVTYDCQRIRRVAHASLTAVETPTPPGMLTPNTVTVHWEFTK